MKFGRIVLQVNAHRLTELDFSYDIKVAAMTSFRVEKRSLLWNGPAWSDSRKLG